MIASAAITTATMMMIPMLMAAIIRPPLATISLRLAWAKPRQGAGLELFPARLRDLTAKTYPRRTPDRLRGGPGAPGRARGDAPRRGRPTQGSCRTAGNPLLLGNRSRETRSCIQTIRGGGWLGRRFRHDLVPQPVLGLFRGSGLRQD